MKKEIKNIIPLYPAESLDPVLANLNEVDRPMCACAHCEAACWYTAGPAGQIKLYAHCKALGEVIYKPDAPDVVNCSAMA